MPALAAIKAQYQTGDKQAALAALTDYLSQNPHHTEALHLLALIQLELNDMDAAEAAFEKAWAQGQNQPLLAYHWGNYLSAQARYAEAKRVYADGHAQAPEDLALQTELGRLALIEGAFEQGVAQLEAVLDEDPQQHEARYALSQHHMKKGDWARATPYLDVLSKALPEQPDLQHQLGLAYFHQGRLKQAEAVFTALLETQPLYGEAHNNLGTIRYLKGDYQGAQAAYQQALAQLGSSEALHQNLGLSFFRQARYREALYHFQQTGAEAQAELAFEWGCCLAYLGQAQDAQTKLAAYLAQEPPQLAQPQQAVQACLLRYQMALQGNQTDAAKAGLDKAQTYIPSAWFRLAKACLLPPIMDSESAQTRWLETYQKGLSRLGTAQASFDWEAAYSEHLLPLGVQYLAYQPLKATELRRLQEARTEIEAACLKAVAFKDLLPLTRQDKGIRIGVISSRLADPEFQALWGPVWQAMSKHFDLYFFIPPTQTPGQLREAPLDLPAQAACQVLPEFLEGAQEDIADLELNILLYTDLHFEPFAGRLAHSRLAPIQAILSDTPLTSGITEIDYFISSTWFLTEADQPAYCEKLVLIEGGYWNMPIYSAAPTEPSKLPRPYILCPAPLPAISPQWDGLLSTLMEKQSDYDLAFFAPRFEAEVGQMVALRQRLSMGIDSARITFFEAPDAPTRQVYLQGAELLLDSPRSDLGRAFQALVLGTPLLTQWGEQLSERWAAGLYRALGLVALIADKDSYVERALALIGPEKESVKTDLSLCRDRLRAQAEVSKITLSGDGKEKTDLSLFGQEKLIALLTQLGERRTG